jgi:hypothetical protein
MTIWRFFRAWSGSEAGRWCRRCLEPIRRDDPFGRSESVCAPCRAAAE